MPSEHKKTRVEGDKVRALWLTFHLTRLCVRAMPKDQGLFNSLLSHGSQQQSQAPRYQMKPLRAPSHPLSSQKLLPTRMKKEEWEQGVARSTQGESIEGFHSRRRRDRDRRQREIWRSHFRPRRPEASFSEGRWGLSWRFRKPRCTGKMKEGRRHKVEKG